MKILALDSTTKTASVAVTENERTLALFTSDSGLTQSELLLPMSLQAMEAARVTASAIDLFAVTVGPGSFTGVRIGVAVIKGLCFGSGRPCAAVSALEAMAEMLSPLDGILCPVMDARRAQVYSALFRTADGSVERLCEDDLIPIDALLTKLQDYPCPVYLTGDAAVAVRARAKEIAPALALPPIPEALSLPSAAAVARCGLRAYLRGETISDERLAPIYLRLPQAERERLERLKEDQKGE